MLPRLRSIALISAISISLAGCAANQRALQQAGAEQGRAAAGVTLPGWPGHCRQAVPHAALGIGLNAVVILRQERLQLDFANQRAANCAAHYDQLKAGLERK